ECYWPVESTNLPNINESLLLFTEQLAQAGARTARELYGCDGWCAHHGVDIWFNTSPTDGQTYWGLYPMAGVWIMQQLYEHFKFNPDTTYLRRIYPLLKGSTEFLLDFMVTDPESGYLVTVPSTSPENSFLDEQGRSVGVSFGSAGDIQLARNQIRNFIEASTFLSTDPELRQKAIRALEKLPPHKIGRYGQLQEWFFDFKEAEPTHRHTSHLLAVYPDDDITLRKTPELAEAAKVVLQRRGDINMGWSGAWKINLLARLEESEEAYEILHKMLTDVSIHPRSEDSRISPSFEGNQGIQAVTSGIGEMLLQSHSGEIYLLPALPSAWKNGTVEGLRARGGFEVDLRWEEGSLSEAVINATQNGVCKLRAKTAVKISTGGIQVASSSNKDGVVEFQTKSGKAYLVESL
ncbi:MAG TPA: hypothetical protein VNQ55_07665, partial [Parapedobacter sp.]|nr:hypothetical protein [Parapedobacter sp.]